MTDLGSDRQPATAKLRSFPQLSQLLLQLQLSWQLHHARSSKSNLRCRANKQSTQQSRKHTLRKMQKTYSSPVSSERHSYQLHGTAPGGTTAALRQRHSSSSGLTYMGRAASDCRCSRTHVNKRSSYVTVYSSFRVYARLPQSTTCTKWEVFILVATLRLPMAHQQHSCHCQCCHIRADLTVIRQTLVFILNSKYY